MGLGGSVDQPLDARRRRQRGQPGGGGGGALLVLGHGQTLVNEQAQHALAGAVAHDGRHVGIAAEEQFDGEVGQQAAIDDAMAGQRAAEVVAPLRLPDDLLPDEGQAHRHAHPPNDGHAGGGAVVEDEHPAVGGVGGDKGQFTAGGLVEFGKGLAAEAAGLAGGRGLVELGLRPFNEGVGREPAAALDEGEDVGELVAGHQVEDDAVDVALELVRYAGQVDGLEGLAGDAAFQVGFGEGARAAEELLEDGHAVFVLFLERVEHLRCGEAGGGEGGHDGPGRGAQEAAEGVAAPLQFAQRADEHHPLGPTPLEDEIVLHDDPPLADFFWLGVF